MGHFMLNDCDVCNENIERADGKNRLDGICICDRCEFIAERFIGFKNRAYKAEAELMGIRNAGFTLASEFSIKPPHVTEKEIEIFYCKLLGLHCKTNFSDFPAKESAYQDVMRCVLNLFDSNKLFTFNFIARLSQLKDTTTYALTKTNWKPDLSTQMSALDVVEKMKADFFYIK